LRWRGETAYAQRKVTTQVLKIAAVSPSIDLLVAPKDMRLPSYHPKFRNAYAHLLEAAHEKSLIHSTAIRHL